MPVMDDIIDATPDAPAAPSAQPRSALDMFMDTVPAAKQPRTALDQFLDSVPAAKVAPHREPFGPPATLQGSPTQEQDGVVEKRPYYYPDPWAFGETEPLPGPPTPPKMESFGPPAIPTRAAMEASAPRLPRPEVPMETVWNPSVNPAASRLKLEQEANSGKSARDFRDQVVQGAQELAPPMRKALIHSANAELVNSGATNSTIPLGALPPIGVEDARHAASGSNKLLSAGLDVASLAIPEAMIAKPAATLMGLARFMAVKTFIEEGLKHEGVPKEFAELGGTVGGIAAGATKLRDIIDRKIEQHNATAEDLRTKDHVEGIWDTIHQMATDRETAERKAEEAAATGQRGAPNQTAAPAPAAEPPFRHPLQDLMDEATLNPPEEPEAGATVPNIKAFQKAHQEWQKAQQESQERLHEAQETWQKGQREYQKRVHEWERAGVDAAADYMEEHPGVSYDAARAATANAGGPRPQEPQIAEPQIEAQTPEPHPDQFHVPAPPPEEVEPAPAPNNKEQPTASVQTAPEDPRTIAIQMQQLVDGVRNVVMFPAGVGEPALENWPGGMSRVVDDHGNVYAYRKSKDLDAGKIKSAAKGNRLPEILGHAQFGMGTLDKSELEGPLTTVVVRTTDGIEVQSTVTDADHLAQTLEASHALMPVGGSVSQEPADKVVGERAGGAPPAGLPAVGDTIDYEPISLDIAHPAKRMQGVVTELRKDPSTGEMVPMVGSEPIVKWSESGQILSSKGVIQPSTPEPPAAAPAALGNVAPVDGGGLITATGNAPGRPNYGGSTDTLDTSSLKEELERIDSDIRDIEYALEHEQFSDDEAGRDERYEAERRLEDLKYNEIQKTLAVVRDYRQMQHPLLTPEFKPLLDGGRFAVHTTVPWEVVSTKGLTTIEGKAESLGTPAPVDKAPAGPNAFGKGGLNTQTINRLSDDGVLSVDEHGNLTIDESKVPAEQTARAVAAPATTPAPPEIPPADESQPLADVQCDAFPPALDDAPKDEPGHIKLANAALRILQQGEFIGNNVAFQKIADAAFGGSRAGGKYEMKEAYDALEAAVNRYIADSIGPDLLLADPFYALEQLRKLLKSLPTQNVRSEQQELLQQFSTPPTLAFFVAKLANIHASDVVLEPSAGTGSLLAWAKAAGAILHGNEIDPKRAELMAYAIRGVTSTPFNAEHLHIHLPLDVEPTVVVMNPPFSSTGGRVKNNRNSFGYAHVLQALRRLQPGGRLVVILGEGAKPEAPNAQDFWKQILASGSTIRANVGVEGGEYQKYGTGFGNRVIVIDKIFPTALVKQTGHPHAVITGTYNSIEEAYRAVSSIIGERPNAKATVSRPVESTGADLQPGAGQGTGLAGSGSGATGNAGAGQNQSPGSRQPGGDDGTVSAGKPRSQPGAQQPTETGGGNSHNAGSGRGLIEGAGLSIEDLINDTLADLQSAPTPAPPPRATAPPRTSAPTSAPPPRRSPTPAPAPPISAKQAAKDRLRELLNQNPDRPKLQIENSDQHKEYIKLLVKIGSEEMIDGATSFAGWQKIVNDDIGDLVAEVATRAQMTPREVLRQVYSVATQVAARRGVTADPLPEDDSAPEEDSALQPLREEDRVALQARQQSELLNRKEDDGAYVEYVPSIEGLAHPGQLVETKVMASVNPPPVTYRPDLPWDVIAKAPKPLSAAQVEAVARAGMAHESFNDDGQRMALLLGDGTGVGKGQQIAAIVWDNNRQGRKKAIWLTASAGLHKDAKRDFLGIGADGLAEQLRSINDWGPAAKIDMKEGVLFSTYSTFVMGEKGVGGKRRLDQIMEWLGKDGVIIFDEAQKGKNAVNDIGEGSKAGQYMIEIQDKVPEARVVYASATAATTVQNLGYMTRLGLWGKGTPFHQGFGHFMGEIGRGGIAAMEMIARELKSVGRYVSRSISYRGVTFDMKQHEMSDDQRQMYDKAAQAWQLVEQSMMAQLQANNAPRSQFAASQYYSSQQRFFRNLLTAIKVPTVLELVDKSLANNESVIISFIGTGEAQAKRAMSNMATGDEDLDFSPKDILIDVIRRYYPTVLFEEYTDELTGKTKKRPVEGPDGKPLENPDAVRARDELIEQLTRELALPENPIDFIIKQYGRDMVAELTGRKKVPQRNESGVWESVKRVPDDIAAKQINAYEEQQFQNGKKRIALISKASGAGFSLHADRSATNQQHRVHIVMELSWSADDQMQSFGRSHRSNQTSAPEYVIVFTDAGGESRFAATIASRLESLGALTKGQRDAGGATSVLSKYNFETDQGVQAVNAFFNYLLKDNPEIEGVPYGGHEVIRKMGLLRQQYDDDGNPIGPPSVRDQDMTNVRRFGNRILLLEMGERPRRDQNAVFDLFANTFEQMVQRAIENGTLDTGVRLVRGDHVRIAKSKVIAKDEATGAETYRYIIEAERKNRIVPVETVEDLRDKGTGKMMRRREFRGVAEPDQIIWAMRSTTPITDRNGTVQPAFNFIRPATDNPTKFEKIAATDLEANWEPIETQAVIDQITRLDREVRSAEKYLASEKEKAAMGGYSSAEWYEKDLTRLKAERKEIVAQQREAKEKQFDLWQEAIDAAPKSRTERIDMIGGSVLRIWSRLHSGNGRMDIQMAYPESGGSVTGVVMSQGDADDVEAALTGQQVVRSAASAYDAVLRGRETLALVGGIRVAQGRINREPVVELFTQNEYNKRFLAKAGVMNEKVGSLGYRLYIPNDRATGVPMLEAILKQFPIQQQGVDGGLPKLQREDPGGEGPESNRIIRHGRTILLNDRAMGTLIRVWGDDWTVAGAMLDRSMVQFAIRRLNGEGEFDIARALQAATQWGNGSVIAVRSRELSKLKSTLRHERSHLAMEAISKASRDSIEKFGMGLLGEREAEFLNSDEARKALANLARYGYKPGEHAEEMIADLVSGGLSRLGLTVDEAFRLLAKLTDALKAVHGPDAAMAIANLKKVVVPSLRGALHGEADIQDAEGTGVTGTEPVRGPPYVREAGTGVPHLVREDLRSARQGQPEERKSAPAEAVKSDSPSVTLGAFPGGVSVDLWKKQIVPAVEKKLGQGINLVNAMVDFVNPRYRVPTPTMDSISRMTGGRSALEFVLTSKLNHWGDRFRKTPKSESVAFVDRVKLGQPQPDQDLQDAADFIRKSDDDLIRWVNQFKDVPYLEDHFRAIWKVIPGSASGSSGMKGFGRRPLQGSKGYMRQHTLDTMSQGIAMGGVPVTYNPLVMFAMHYVDTMKFVTAQRMWKEFGRMKQRKFIRTASGDKIPDGFIKFDDPIARAMFPVPQGMVDAGTWHVEAHAAHVLHNFLGRDYLRESYDDSPVSKWTGPLGSALLAFKNNTTAIELGLSPYHAVVETIEAMGSMIGIGIREMVNLGLGPLIEKILPSRLGVKTGAGGPGIVAGFARGIKTVASFPAAPVTMAIKGGKAKKAFANYAEMSKTPAGRKWIANNPDAIRDTQYFFIGGGKMEVPEDFQIRAREGFRQYLADATDKTAPGDERIAAASKMAGPVYLPGGRAFAAFNEMIMKPLFGIYIPNLKLSFFLKEFSLAREEYAGRLASGEMTLDTLARRVVDSVENRFGEMNYDKLFWDRTFKTAMQINIRSVTWKMGNIGEAWNAISKQIQESARGAKKREVPLLDMSLGWAFGVALVAAVVGTIMHSLGTGHGPKTIKDVLYPMIDEKTGFRASVPGYAREYHHAWRDPKGYAKSSFSGWLGKFWETLENSDFNRNPIYDEDDDWYKKAAGMVAHQLPAPFGPSAALKALKEGHKTEGILNLFAFTKAPGYADKSNAELLAQELASHHRESGTRSPAQADKARAAASIIKAYRAGEDPGETIRKGIADGVINNKDVVAYGKEARKPQLVSTMDRLTMAEMLRVYDKATEEEHRQIKDLVKNKVYSVKQNHPAEFGKPGSTTRQLSLKYFNTEPFVPRQIPLIGRPQPIL